MKLETVVYRRAVAAMIEQGLMLGQMADKMAISVGSLYNKLRAITPFTLDEAIRMKEILGFAGTVEELFVKAKPGERL